MKEAYNCVGVLTALLLTSAACRDTLHATSNPSGTALLEDASIGENDRVICVLASRKDYCRPDNADVYVTEVPNLMDVSSKWSGDDVVEVRVSAGNIKRFRNEVKSGNLDVKIIRQ